LENQQDSSINGTALRLHNGEDYKASKHVIQTYHLVPYVTVGYSKITVFKKTLSSRNT